MVETNLFGRTIKAETFHYCVLWGASYTVCMCSDDYEEKCVMNNYFGIGLDAKIALEFHQKREEHPEKCRSRTKNMMWFGVLGGKEILARTYRNLDQRVTLDCDGRRIPLPNLQGIVVLNIPRSLCLHLLAVVVVAAAAAVVVAAAAVSSSSSGQQ